MKQAMGMGAVLCGALLLGGAAGAQNGTAGGDSPAQQGGFQPGMQRGPGAGRRGGAIRGTVTAVSGSNVSLKTETGESWTVVTTDNTRVRRDGQGSAVNAIQNGDEVVAMGVPDADRHEVHAMMVMDVSAAEVARAKANLGKTYITGRITAINDTQLTVMRSDRVSQTIQLDESTSLHRGGRPDPMAMQAAGLDAGLMGGMGGGMGMGGRRNAEGGAANAGGSPRSAGGESITLADVKVGDNVLGLGSLKNGTFVPTDLHVMQRPAGRGPGNSAGSGDTPPPPPPEQ